MTESKKDNARVKKIREILMKKNIVKNNEEFGHLLGYENNSAQMASDFCTGNRPVPERVKLQLYKLGLWDTQVWKVTGRNVTGGNGTRSGSITAIIFAEDARTAILKFKYAMNQKYGMVMAEPYEQKNGGKK